VGHLSTNGGELKLELLTLGGEKKKMKLFVGFCVYLDIRKWELKTFFGRNWQLLGK